MGSGQILITSSTPIPEYLSAIRTNRPGGRQLSNFFLHQIVDHYIGRQRQEYNCAQVMDIMGHEEFGQPAETGNIGDIVAFENRHLAKTGQNQGKSRHQVNQRKAG